MIDNAELTVVINSCDAYSDVLKLFFAAFNEYWPDCPFQIVINTEENIYTEYPAVTHNFTSGLNGDKWGARLRSTLESIDSEFVLMLYDDFIIEKPMNVEAFNRALNLFAEDPGAAVAYLTHIGLPVKYLSEDSRFAVIDDFVDYRLNSAPAIWKRSQLLKYVEGEDSPWAWEVFGSYRTYGDKKNFYCPKSQGEDVYVYDYHKGGAIYRGKWVRKVVEDKVVKYKLDIDLLQRGFSEVDCYEKRSLGWKIDFMILGFKMVGFKSFRFISRYIKARLNG